MYEVVDRYWGKVVSIELRKAREWSYRDRVQQDDNLRYFANGMYAVDGDHPGPFLEVKVFIEELGQNIIIDIYRAVRDYFGIKNISKRRLTKMREHIGENVEVYFYNPGDASFIEYKNWL